MEVYLKGIYGIQKQLYFVLLTRLASYWQVKFYAQDGINFIYLGAVVESIVLIRFASIAIFIGLETLLEDNSYPKMIELFCRSDYELHEMTGVTPIHIDDTVSSLSAILLDDQHRLFI